MVESGQLKLLDERRTLAEMSLITKQKRMLEELASGNGKNDDVSQEMMDALKRDLTQINAQIDKLTAAQNAKWEEQQAVRQKSTAQRSDLDKLYSEKESIYNQLKVARSEKDKIMSDYRVPFCFIKLIDMHYW